VAMAGGDVGSVVKTHVDRALYKKLASCCFGSFCGWAYVLMEMRTVCAE
jgi:hypothetical protein